MTKGQKALVWTLSIAVGGVATYLIYRAMKCRINPAKCTPEGEETLLDSAIEKTKEIVSGESSKGTPFKTKKEGDTFRAWVNDKYSEYAKSIDLDRSGKYDNSYIRKAWAKFGEEYSKLSAKPTTYGLIDVQSNLGNNYVADLSRTDRIVVKGKIYGRHQVNFYNNGRFAILDVGSDEDPTILYKELKGNWYEGGKKLKTDAGNTYLNTSVIKNLTDAIKNDRVKK
jgi:hypothetical protein